MNKLSTKPYKGVRDFYPQDWMFQKWMFWKMKEVCERFGYENYNASPLEPTELYEAKSGQEIVGNETYNMIDRGDRKVTIRPEMTPTVARMVADQMRELPKPIRWYSIPNLFRYERPQRGRLREHYQLNVDIFGSDSIHADVEVIQMGYEIMKNFGAQDNQFVININNRKIIQSLFETYLSDDSDIYAVSKIIDKKKKLSEEEFASSLEKYLGGNTADFITKLSVSSLDEIDFMPAEELEKTRQLIKKLQGSGITNVSFDLTLMRGFDYYTDIVFEFFDTHPENNRSLFGGGRYDDLLDIFGMEKIPAIGFGMGDVTARDFLETHGLMPDLTSHTHLVIVAQDEDSLPLVQEVATELRDSGINVEIDFTFRKFEKVLAAADKKRVPFFIAVGENEVTSKMYQVKDLTTGEKMDVDVRGIIETITGPKK